MYIHNENTEAFFNTAVNAYHAALNGRNPRSFSAVLEGPPGCGKTHLVRELAKFLSAPFFKMTGFGIMEAKEIFYTVSTRKMHAGEGMVEKTQLWKAVEATHDGPVIFLLDEGDKATYEVDGALLQLLDDQDGYFTDPYGTIIQAEQRNLFFFMTSNGRREISPEFRRRGTNMVFPPPDAKQFVEIVKYQEMRDSVEFPTGLINYAIKVAINLRTVIKDAEMWPVPDEVTRFMHQAVSLKMNQSSVSVNQLEFLLRVNLCKGASDKRWEQYKKHINDSFGRIGQALKSELYAS